MALTGLSGDIASFYNLDTDTAFEKIRSGISGETEPLKQLGINMSVANLEAYALSKGITKSYNAMSQAEQVLLRYNYLLSVTTDAQGDFARTSGSFANQIRILQLNFDQLRIAVGNAIIPIAQAVLPGINAIISALTKLATVFAQVTALLFGKSTEVTSQSGVASSAISAADATDQLAESTEGAGSAAKKAEKDMKGVRAGFDDLNILASNAASSLDDAAGGLDMSGIDTSVGEMWSDAEINPNLSAEIYALTEKLKDMIPLIAGVGAGLLAWKIANSLVPDLGVLQGLLGSLVVAAGITLLVDSIKNIVFGTGLTWKNILEGAYGGALAGAGLGYMLASKLGLTWTQGMLGGAIIGLGVALLIESVADIITRGLNVGNGILGAIGGAIAGAAAGFLYMGGPGGALLGATIGVGIALVIESIADIISSGLNLSNGVLGAIGGALAGAGAGFYLGGPGGALVGAVIGVGLVLTLEGIVAQFTGGVDIVGALMTVLGSTLTGAGLGFAFGGPIGAGIGAVIGFVAGLVIEITGVKMAGDAVYQTTEDFQTMKRVIDECGESSNRSSFAMKNLSDNINGLSTSMADVGAAQSLADEIYAINDNANASAYELELMATKVELLNSMGLDGLQLTIDETTGRIIETKEATDQLIASIQKEAEAAALQELLVQAYKDRYQAVSDAEQAVKNVTVAEQALAETEKELTNTPWWDLEKQAALTAQQEKQTEALEAATDARDQAVEAYDKLSGAIDTYSGALTNLQEPEAGVGVQLEARMDSVRQTVESVAADMPGYGQNIGDGLEQGMANSITEAATVSIFGRIGEWFKKHFGIHSPSTVFAEFGGFLISGLYDGMDEKIPSVENLFSEFLEETKMSTSTAWKDVETDTLSKWDDIGKGLSNKFSEIDNYSFDGFKTIKETIINKIDETMTDLLGKDWRTVGENIVDGILNGLAGIFNNLRGWASNVWSTITGSFSSSKAKSSITSGINYAPRLSTVEYATYSAKNLPKLANGAVIPPNQQFAAILGDQRSGKNLEAPAGLIRQLITEGIQAAGGVGRSSGNMTVIMEIDGREFGRASYKYGTAEQQRVGVRLAEVRT